ncbi:hypothetical protein [Sunxiuqinia indica]|uniref:hypothetical protein n=1 Tax=Sunxiuqinia indica TaxID=2692584 RepID=UPI0013597023|nr:hypothetical protein [Sunxiuqinia indica]
MKNRILILLLLGLLMVTCKKEEAQTEFPVWLQTKIDEVTSNENMCDICHVTISEFEGKLYYNLYCDLWSCAYCHFYDEDGSAPDWDADKWNRYFADKKEVSTVPACP